MEIWTRCEEVIARRARRRPASRAADLAAVGVTNQRETTVVWDRSTGKPVAQRHRLAGHPHRPTICNELGQGRRPGPLPARRSACRWPPTSPAPRSSGCWRTSRAPRAKAEAGDLLFGNIDTWLHLEPHRRRQRRRPRHRRHQRQPHHADEPRDPRLGPRDPGASWASRAPCCRQIRPSSEVYGTARRRRWPACRWRATWATSRRPSSARPASRPARPRTPTAPAASCCSTRAPSRCQSKNGLLTTLGYKIGDAAGGLLPWRARSRSPARWCSGCATTSA